MSFSLVAPEQFTARQQQYLEKFRRSIDLVSSQAGAIVGAKDVDSRHLIATDSYARIVGLSKGGDVTGRFDREMPCEGTAQFADCYVREDRDLLSHRDPGRMTSVINIHEYSDGLKGLVFNKFALKHRPTKSILGTIYSAYEFDISRFFAMLPNYTFEFGAGCSIARADDAPIEIETQFTEFEYEIAFLLTMGWSLGQIRDFLSEYRRGTEAGVIASVRTIGDKLGGGLRGASALRDRLVELGVHRKMPKALFDHVTAAQPLRASSSLREDPP